MAWQKFSVELKGEAEPIIVQTSARDWASISMDAAAPKAMQMTFQVVQAALLRQGHEVPRDLDGFMDVLEGLPEALDEGEANALDPTPQDR